MILKRHWSTQQAYNNITREEFGSLTWVNICIMTVSDTIYQALSFIQTSKSPDSVANKMNNDQI